MPFCRCLKHNTAHPDRQGSREEVHLKAVAKVPEFDESRENTPNANAWKNARHMCSVSAEYGSCEKSLAAFEKSGRLRMLPRESSAGSRKLHGAQPPPPKGIVFREARGYRDSRWVLAIRGVHGAMGVVRTSTCEVGSQVNIHRRQGNGPCRSDRGVPAVLGLTALKHRKAVRALEECMCEESSGRVSCARTS